MKKFILISLIALMASACGNNQNKKTIDQADASTVYVYYFHGKQRCKTCMAVEEVAKKAVSGLNSPIDAAVKFVEVKTDEADNAALVEKYQVTWNALIIAKGDDHVDITKEAFANAINQPDSLYRIIRGEALKRLE